ncbi:MAG: TolC family protein, partial [Sedimentisphaerales bacterium]|nr:TolC family protein [Sedimentisphaerales bacterium]
GTEHYKTDADREVYQIIDQKWYDNLGPQTNYKIGDVGSSPNDVNIAVPPINSGRFSLVSAVALATASNRSYQSQKEDIYLSVLDLTMQRHRFKPHFYGLLGTGYTYDDQEESVDFDSQFGFNQLLADGASISVGVGLDWFRFLTGDPRSSLGSVLTATVTQPLLRGRGRTIVQENLTQAERNTIYELRSFSRFRKEFVVSTVSEYYRVLQMLDAVKNDKNNYDSLLLSQKRIEAMAETGRLPRYQEGDARQSTLQAEQKYIRSQELYKATLDQFKLRLALPTDTVLELDPNELIALETVGVTDPNFDLTLAVETALENRLDLANVREQLEDAQRKVKVAADNLGAELNLIGSARVNSEERTNLGNLQFHRGDYEIGLEADLPLDRKAERNAYREALINVMRKQRDYEQKNDQVKLDVRQAFRDMSETYNSYRIQLLSLNLAEKRVEMQLILLQEDRGTTRDYLFAQEDLLRAQNEKTNALV